MGETDDERTAQASQLFENFVQASTCKGTLQAFSILCRQLELDPLDHSQFYSSLKAAVSTWKVKALWTTLDKRAQHKVYNQNKACQGTRCLIIGGGPCGLRTAIELALLGCKAVVIEKRDTFSRNNVLHLWPFTIHDLRGLGAKKFYGKFCAGSIDHISIRQLQLMLLKVSLILGVEIHVNVEFVKLLEPLAGQTDESPGWRAEVQPSSHPVSDTDFDVVIGADGRKNTLDGFSRKEFRGKLAIAITANFINRNTTAEAKVEEISGVAFIFNQKFFLELKEETGIDLENIVYYKDNTHYFVMTAKKQSLLDKGVIINDYIETERLLSADNVNQEALLSYAREAADFGTNYQLPSLDYAINHYGEPDVAMFDFTSMYASENAALIREKHGHQLLVALVGDSLLEPFWPMGTGCARGFLAAFDTAWMVRGWAQGRSPLEILAERESIYRLLPQTTTENISKNFEQYTIDPATRYPNLISSCVRPHQVCHLYIDGQQDSCNVETGAPTRRLVNLSRTESEVRPGRLLTWCQKQAQGYRGVDITNLTSSWRNGLALCALIHRQRPELIDYESLKEEDVIENNQLAFDVAEREFSIQPVTTGKEMAVEAEPDKLLMVLYLSKFYELFRNSSVNNALLNSGGPQQLSHQPNRTEPDENSKDYPSKTNHRLLSLPPPRKRIPRDDKTVEDDSINKRRRKGSHYLTEISCHSALPTGEDGELRENKVRSMATQLLAKFEENTSTAKTRSMSDEDPSNPSYSPTLSPSTTPLPLSNEEDGEEENKERDNPRFAKPKDIPSPPLPPRCPKWQPSIYLRLLENSSSSAPHTSFLYSPKPSHPQSGYSCSPPPSCFRSPLTPPHSSSLNVTEHDYPECSFPELATSHFSACILSSIDHPIEWSDELMQQSKSQKLTTREFSRRSLKERAVLLCSMFPESNKPTPAPLSPPSESQCNGTCALENARRITKKSIVDYERCPSGAPNYIKERTVGKVSTAIDAKAQILAILYETDHRPNTSLCVVRKDFPARLGGSNVCHFCTKRVYVMERLSAEGYFFHRECFRCYVCNCTLRLGGHTFDSQEAKFYCKMHYAQRQSTTHLGRFRRRMDDQSRVTPLLLGSGSYSATGSIQIHPPDGESSLHSEQPDKVQKRVSEETEIAVEVLDASCIVKSTAQDTTRSKGQNHNSTKDHRNTKQNNRWKRKIRATVPLIFIKHFQRSWPLDKEGPETVPENNSDFEEITAAEKQTVPAETEADKPHTDSGQEGELSRSQTSASSHSAFQLIANAFRKTFSVTNPSGSSNSAVTTRCKRDGPHKQRPMSEGAFSFSSLFSTVAPEPSREEMKAGKREVRWASVGADPWGAGQDLPSLLQQVSLKGWKDSGGVFTDDMGSLPRRRIDLFSSLRLRKREVSESEGKDQEVENEIRTILTNLRNKAFRQQNLEEPSSSADENESLPLSQKLCTQRKRRKQEKIVAQQTKREQMKRLHRAQVIQRQLEEVGEKQRDVEERGVAIEKIIRGETESSQTDDSDKAQLYQSWFKLVLEKNRMARYESELMIFAQELELEDTQSQLQQDLRCRMAIEDTKKSASELQEEQQILSEIMRTVEKRDMLVSILEEQRLKERAEDRDLESLVLSKGYEFHWSQVDDSWGQEKLEWGV
ncbi:protein-methionine sulfoxide oxidase mical2b isoform X2 [Xiphias gladius]|uniref:protein-methionine sulfoxide oxidase mical2b isoform X2 n=1 Tax=Xiphias gladius TaxID=8245 RepID=UPI001A97F26C|nr:protein-methionine sulfoxide oxidase mical2b isoform X2 [Xiphias gladius]